MRKAVIQITSLPGDQKFKFHDIDGDGTADVIWQDKYDGNPDEDGRVEALYNWDGTDGGFDRDWVKENPTPVGSGWFLRGSGDYDGDGDEDLLW